MVLNSEYDLKIVCLSTCTAPRSLHDASQTDSVVVFNSCDVSSVTGVCMVVDIAVLTCFGFGLFSVSPWASVAYLWMGFDG